MSYTLGRISTVMCYYRYAEGGVIKAKVDSTTDLDYMYFSEINTIC